MNRPLRVLLVANYTIDQQHSMLDYAANLAEHLSTPHKTKIIRPRALFGRLPIPLPSIRKWLAYIDKFILFPFELYWCSRRFDIVHVCDQGNGMYALYPIRALCLITCHDVTEIRRARDALNGPRVKWTGRIFQRLNLAGLRHASRVVCHSRGTAEVLIALSGISPDRVGIVDNGLKHPYFPMSSDNAWSRLARLGIARGENFLLHVGGNQWYKNRRGVVRIFKAFLQLTEADDFHLILAGRALTPELRAEIEHMELSDRIHVIVDSDNEDLRALYSVAYAFLFPSLTEGYGLPIIEAQACGCPVFASRRAPMTEVGGDAARYFNPEAVEEAAAVILRNSKERESMREEGLRNARRFSPESVSIAYLEQYRLTTMD